MISRLEEFFQLLRRNGVRVSTGEALDAARAVALVGLGRPGPVRAALAATTIKRRGDAAIFHELFDLYFLRRVDVDGADEAPLAALLRAVGLGEEEIESVLAEIASEAARMTPAARMALGLRRADFALLARLAGVRLDLLGLVSPLQVGFMTQRILGEVGILDAEREARALADRLAGRLGAERAQAVARAIEEGMRRLRSLARGAVAAEAERQENRRASDLRSEDLRIKPFSILSDAERHALRAEVARLARKLRADKARRHRPRRRGRLDVRRTLRASLATGGVPFRLRFRSRPADRPNLVLLVDISDSMRDVARFMLEVVYTLHEEFHEVRSFAFVSQLGELSGLFREHPIGEAIARAYAGAVVDVHGNSNCGRAFATFRDRHLDAVGPRTTVVVISDGRNNYFPANAACLADIRRRARRLLWLSPEAPSQWGFGDSAMRDYLPHCDRVEIVYNLDGLRRAVDLL